jgi:hypothetical protein
MEYLNGSLFDWLSWRAGNLTECLNLQTRENIIVSNSEIIRKHAIGWCRGENIVCRPKRDTMAVMFFTDEVEWWTHFTIKEFVECFPELKDKI